jgi:hypothetical protein
MWVSENQRRLAKNALGVIADRLALNPDDIPSLIAPYIEKPLLMADLLIRDAVPHERLTQAELDQLGRSATGIDEVLNRLRSAAFYQREDIERLLDGLRSCPNTALCVSVSERLKPNLRAAQAELISDEQWQTVRVSAADYFGLTDAIAVTGKEDSFRRAGHLPIEGYHPTPPAVIKLLVARAELSPGVSVLEPSAGRGDIALALRELGYEPDVAELDPTLRRVLTEQKLNVVARDFFTVTKKYDRIIQNPPFEHQQDLKHIQHAFGLLTPGGILVSVCSEGSFGRRDGSGSYFRDWLAALDGKSERLPSDAFKESTNPASVPTRIVKLVRPIELGTEAPSRLRQLIAENADVRLLTPAVEHLDIETLRKEIAAIQGNATLVATLQGLLTQKIRAVLADQPIRQAWALADKVAELDVATYPARSQLQKASEELRQAIGIDALSVRLLNSWQRTHLPVVSEYGGALLRAELQRSMDALQQLQHRPLLERLLALLDNHGQIARAPKMAARLIANETDRQQLRELSAFVKRQPEHILAQSFGDDIKAALATKDGKALEADPVEGGDDLREPKDDYVGDVVFPLNTIQPLLSQIAWSISTDATRRSLCSAWSPRTRTLVSTNGHALSRVVADQDLFEQQIRIPHLLAKKIVSERRVGDKRLRLKFGTLPRSALLQPDDADGNVYSVTAWIGDKSLGSYEIGDELAHPPYEAVMLSRQQPPKLMEFETLQLQGAVTSLIETSKAKGVKQSQLFAQTSGVVFSASDGCATGSDCQITLELFLPDRFQEQMIEKQRVDYATLLTLPMVYDANGHAYKVKEVKGRPRLTRLPDGEVLTDWERVPLFASPASLGQVVQVSLSLSGALQTEMFGIDLKYLYYAVTACKGTKTYVSLANTSLDPVRFDSDGYTAIVMPVRL